MTARSASSGNDCWTACAAFPKSRSTARPPRRTGWSTVSFLVEGYPSQDIGAILDDSFDIAVRCGLHCAPYCHRQLGTFPDGTVRASIGYFNTEADVDALVEAVKQIAASG